MATSSPNIGQSTSLCGIDAQGGRVRTDILACDAHFSPVTRPSFFNALLIWDDALFLIHLHVHGRGLLSAVPSEQPHLDDFADSGLNCNVLNLVKGPGFIALGIFFVAVLLHFTYAKTVEQLAAKIVAKARAA